jgi:hypothetical protein
VPVVHRPARPARRRRRTRRPARQPRRRREGAAAAHPRLRRRARLAPAAHALLGRHHLQPRLPRRDRRRPPATHAQRVPPRRGHDPPLLGLGAPLRPGRPRAGPPPRRHPRAAVEPLRPHPHRARDRLGRAAELPLAPARGAAWHPGGSPHRSRSSASRPDRRPTHAEERWRRGVPCLPGDRHQGRPAPPPSRAP